MRASRAYIASAGTAAVMLGASLCCFVLLSAFVAFGAWPGAKSATNVDQFVLRSVQRPHVAKVTVRRDAVQIAQRQAAARRAARTVALAKPRGTGLGAAPTGATQLAAAPTSGAGGSSKSSGGGGSGTVNNVTNQVNNTTKTLPPPVQQNTQQVTTQVEQVVNQVAPPGGTPDTSGATQQVQTTTGSILGH